MRSAVKEKPQLRGKYGPSDFHMLIDLYCRGGNFYLPVWYCIAVGFVARTSELIIAAGWRKKIKIRPAPNDQWNFKSNDVRAFYL